MRYKYRVKPKNTITSQIRNYNATFFDTLQDRIRHLGNYERPTFYNKQIAREERKK